RWAGLREQRGARDLGKKSRSGLSNEASTFLALIWTPSDLRIPARRFRFMSRWFRFHLSKAARSAKNAHLFIRSKGEIFVAFVISFVFGSCIKFSPWIAT